jgi:methyl-accepting chemotaxis protein
MFGFIVAKFQGLKLSIRYKVGAVFGLVLLCFVVSGILSVWQLEVIQKADNRQQAVSLELEKVQNLKLFFQAEVEIYSDTIFLTRNSTIRDRFKSYILQEISGDVKVNIDRQSFNAQFATLYNNAFDKFTLLENTISKADTKRSMEVWQTAAPVFDKITKFLEDKDKEFRNSKKVAEEDLSKAVTLSIALVIGFTVACLILVILLSILIEQAIIEPLRKLERKLKDVSEGNLAYQLKIFNRDEIGRVAESLQNALEVLRQVISGVQINESLQTVIRQLLGLSQQQEHGAQEQVASLNQVSASIKELGYNAAAIAGNADKVKELTGVTLEQIKQVAEASRQSQHQVNQMSQTVNQTLDGVEKIGRQVNDFSTVIVDLNRQAEAIGKIVSLIRTIADEVRLLAFNAAIESAQAGEFGERFRVVAREIKILAGRTNNAAQEAQEMIGLVQNSSRLALAEMDNGQREIQKVIDSNSGLPSSLQTLENCAGQVDQAVRQLNDFAHAVSTQIEEIQLATRHQQIANEQIIQSLQSVGVIAEQNSSATKQITGNSNELERVAFQLNTVLNRIVLPA